MHDLPRPHNDTTMWGKKLHRFIYAMLCQNFWHTYTSIIFLSSVYSIFFIYNQRRGTSLSFKSTAGQRTVHTAIVQFCG